MKRRKFSFGITSVSRIQRPNLYPIICENLRNLWIEAVNPQSLTNEVCVLANEPAYLTHHVEGKRQQAIGYIGTAGESRL